MFISSRSIKCLVVLLALAVVICTPIIAYQVSKIRLDGVIVIDAGHGGMDGGVTYGDIKESDLNLSIARKLKSKLESSGIKVIMTRDGKSAIAPSKSEDMAKRGEIIRSSGADMVVSIHINKFSDSRRRGVQVFYDDTKRWKREGMAMQNILNSYINRYYAKREDLVAIGGDYFITKCSDIPSIIVECGFISNADDRRLLQDKEYTNRLTDAISMGLMTLLEY